MMRNVIKSDYRSSKMASGGHFVKRNLKKFKVVYSKMAGVGDFVKRLKKKSCILI